MKHMTSLLGILLAVSVSAPAFARGPNGTPANHPTKAQILKKYDKDGNGKLDPVERQALRKERIAKRANRKAERRAAMLKKYDTNGDGTIGPAEKAKLKADRQAMQTQRRAKMFATIDTNNDGVISKAEFMQAKPGKMMRHKRGSHRGGHRGGPRGGGNR